MLLLSLRFETHRIPQFAIKTLYRLRRVVAVLHGRLSSLVHTKSPKYRCLTKIRTDKQAGA